MPVYGWLLVISISNQPAVCSVQSRIVTDILKLSLSLKLHILALISTENHLYWPQVAKLDGTKAS